MVTGIFVRIKVKTILYNHYEFMSNPSLRKTFKSKNIALFITNFTAFRCIIFRNKWDISITRTTVHYNFFINNLLTKQQRNN